MTRLLCICICSFVLCVKSLHTSLHGIFEFDIAKKMFFPKDQIRFGDTIHYIDDLRMKHYNVIASITLYDDEAAYPRSLMFYKDSTIYSVLHHPRMDLVQMFKDVRQWHDSKCSNTKKLKTFLYDRELQRAWKDCIF